MKSFFIFILLTVSTITLAADSNLEWTDPNSGTYYNIASLKKDPRYYFYFSNPWKVKDGADNGLFSMVYYFNFGQNHNQKCKGQQVGVSEVLEVLKQATDTCEVLGRTESKEWALLDKSDPKKGVSITYGNGDRCTNGDNPAENGRPRRSRFLLFCSSNQEENFKVNLPGNTQGTTKCTLEFKIYTPAGCPGGGLGYKSSMLLLYFAILLVGYLIIGSFYNIRVKNLNGVEALPHIEFWRTFPELVQEGFAFTVSSLKNCFDKIKAKFSGEKTEYNEF